jgi:UDP-N-acetylglucosamine 2-epimerase (non-hydrolysing)
MANWSPPRRTLLFVAGTRPEAIKLAPLILALAAHPRFSVLVCASAQHRDLLDAVFAGFGIVPDFDLDIMRVHQMPVAVVAGILSALAPIVEQVQPDALIVQGDTATAFAGAQVGAYARVPVIHVEAGLRSGQDEPFPEEMHRRAIAQIASLHFAPTEAARLALHGEGIDAARIHVTGNTGIDALLATARAIGRAPELRAAFAHEFAGRDPARALVLATMHRRENHGHGIAQFIAALRDLAAQDHVDIVVPLHPHPAVGAVIIAQLTGVPHIRLVPPLDYPAFIHLLGQAHVVITDSGGIQEEAPALGVPVLVLRDVTERSEGVAAGVAQVIGTSRTAIVDAVRALLHDETAHARMARAVFPYGDGRATDRIIAVLDRVFGNATEEPVRRTRAKQIFARQ